MEGRFLKGNSVCSGHVKFELFVGHLSGPGQGNLELSGLASIPQGNRSWPRVPGHTDPPTEL